MDLAPLDFAVTGAWFQPTEHGDNVIYLGDRKVVSFGPRRKDDPNESAVAKLDKPPAEGEAIDHWTIYFHGADQEPQWVMNLPDANATLEAARHLFRSWLLTGFLQYSKDPATTERAFVEQAQELIDSGERVIRELAEFWSVGLQVPPHP